jgi:hypothetical protein
MFLTMVISGVWHGAAWTFLIWGLLHAVGRVLTRSLEQTPFYRHRVPRIVKQGAVFAFVCFAWIFFRASSIQDAWLILTRIATSGWADPAFPLLALGLVLAVWAYQLFYESKARWVVEWQPVQVGVVVLVALYLATFAVSSAQPFIYFQF